MHEKQLCAHIYHLTFCKNVNTILSPIKLWHNHQTSKVLCLIFTKKTRYFRISIFKTETTKQRPNRKRNKSLASTTTSCTWIEHKMVVTESELKDEKDSFEERLLYRDICTRKVNSIKGIDQFADLYPNRRISN